MHRDGDIRNRRRPIINCTGTGSFSSITTTNLTTAGETGTGSLTVGGTLAVGGYMGCACTVNYYNYGTFVNNSTTSVKWGAMTSYGPQTITHTTNAAPFKVANASFYMVMANLTIDSTGYGGQGPTASSTAPTTRRIRTSSWCSKTINFQVVRTSTATAC